MPKTHESNNRSDHDSDYQYYYFRDLVAAGIVKNRTDLSRKRRFEDFPDPEKSSDAMQASAPFRKSKVHAWLDRRAARRSRDAAAGVNDPEQKRRRRPRRETASIETIE
ncbi:hypothetical protein QC756_09125 [Sinorhizobium meliloti]|uniref:hypothetical protein n=1 Tax=Rhizobium meliloti TaxID=382 RepID=UPI000FDB8877|nr:hypothetical protein [Sinorhizobium meliloti]MDX0800689.1 hypothetical protein [Sinorhizobium medicae]MDX0979590.1 hypothetical protein [Sinorhizobium medicae]RVK64197.1 hypothetical protein CN154_33400 [Sinorhizobium meliloti]WGI76010.1 hypothetical protein QC756_09125 [Sinorhizobium meliloti]